MQLKMSLRGKDLSMWLLQNKNSVVICLEERVLVLLFLTGLATHGKSLSCIPHLSKMSSSIQSSITRIASQVRTKINIKIYFATSYLNRNMIFFFFNTIYLILK